VEKPLTVDQQVGQGTSSLFNIECWAEDYSWLHVQRRAQIPFVPGSCTGNAKCSGSGGEHHSFYSSMSQKLISRPVAWLISTVAQQGAAAFGYNVRSPEFCAGSRLKI
jgi:hypothetical protein